MEDSELLNMQGPAPKNLWAAIPLTPEVIRADCSPGNFIRRLVQRREEAIFVTEQMLRWVIRGETPLLQPGSWDPMPELGYLPTPDSRGREIIRQRVLAALGEDQRA
ncbi:MAG: hypothetical protein C4521_07655 [Actinobacteria bacterium]|nr:MAG: hypothetical protein C4521_07655 [Actinomycetota bacterium]